MRLGILTDIHGNREAFAAALADLAERGVDRLALLGDIVGYGPDPEWCLAKAADLLAKGALAVRGNHDDAIARPDPAMSNTAREVIDWTRPRLDSAARAFLAGLPLWAEIEGPAGSLRLVHASPQTPEQWLYVTNEARARGAIAASSARITLVGHVHVPALYSADPTGVVRGHGLVMGQPMPLLRSRRWLGVIGAVGQPRDGVAKAGYGVVDLARGELSFRHVGYDVAATVAKLRAHRLPEKLAQRLMNGG